jgi:hypothetical protein
MALISQADGRYMIRVRKALEASKDPTARANQTPDPYSGSPTFQEWSKARLAHLKARAERITAIEV